MEQILLIFSFYTLLIRIYIDCIILIELSINISQSKIPQILQKMFSTDILQIQNSMSIPFSYQSKQTKSQESSIFDLQYELYSKYMKLSKQQITVKQFQLINDSQNFIQSLATIHKIDLFKQVSSTVDSFSYDEDFESSIINDQSIIQRKSSKKITRKGQRTSLLKKSIHYTNDQYQQVLSQISKFCNQKTLFTVKSLIQQHQKNLTKIVEVDKKQKSMKKIQDNSQKMDQQNFLFKAKINDFEQKIKIKDEQIKSLKEKLQQYKIVQKQNKIPLSNCNQKQLSQQLNMPKNSYQKNLFTLLSQKQSMLIQRTKNIQCLQQKIQACLQKIILQKSNTTNCTKCCTLIRKIKESVMNYRKYLEEQAQEYQKLYHKLRETYENTGCQLIEQRIQLNQQGIGLHQI